MALGTNIGGTSSAPSSSTPADAAASSLGITTGPAGGTESNLVQGSQTGADTTVQTEKEAAAEKAVDKKCGGGCGGENIPAQCSTFQSKCNAQCQKIMAPFTDKCSSCGGSGTEGGGNQDQGDSGSDGGDSGSGGSGGVDTPAVILSFNFDAALTPFTPVPASTSTTTQVSFTSRGLLRFNKEIYTDVTTIYISEIDRNGINVNSVLDALTTDSLISLYNEDRSIYSSFKFVSQIDSGDYRTITVTCHYTDYDTFAASDIVFLNTPKAGAPVVVGSQLAACPHCGGSGLEGGSGIDGLIMAVYNGAAGFAGVNNIDIYGIVQPS